VAGPATFSKKDSGVNKQFRFATTLAAVVITGAVAAGCSTWGHGAARLKMSPREAYEKARRTVLQASSDRAGEVRSRAMEVLAATEGAEVADVFVLGLRDPDVGVRFAAVMALGDSRHAPATEVLRGMLAAPQTNANVRCAVIYALDRLGDRGPRGQLGLLLADASPEVRANAALVVAKIGDPAGVQPLRDRLGSEQHPGVKYQLTESLAALGYPLSISMLSAKIRMGQPYEKLRALQALGRTRSGRARNTLLQVFKEERAPLMRIAAAGALARLGDSRGYDLALQATVDPDALARESYDRPVRLSDPQRHQMQMLGALALGQMRRPAAAGALVGLLDGPERSLAIAAAKSIMMLLAPHRPPITRASPSPTTRPGSTAPKGAPATGQPHLHTAPPRE